MKETYVTAVLEALAETPDSTAVLNGLQATLKKRGHAQLYAGILRSVLRTLEAATADATILSVTRAEDIEAKRDAIAAAYAALGVTGEPTITIDDTLIGGFVVEHAGTRYDASYKRALVDLYRSLTT